MTETKTMDILHRGLVKKFHTLCTLLHLSPSEKAAIVASFGVESSRDIDTHDLVDLVARLSSQYEQKDDLSRLRRRTMAAIGDFLKASGRESNADLIKAIACRASRYSDFNRIPKHRLQSITAAFNHAAADFRAAQNATAEAMVMRIIDNNRHQPLADSHRL